MALRSFVRQLPSDPSAVRAYGSQLQFLSFHTDGTPWQDRNMSAQEPRERLQGRSDRDAQRQQQTASRVPDSAVTKGEPEQQQSARADQRQREFPRSQWFQLAGNDVEDRHKTPAANIARPNGPARWPSNLAERYDRTPRPNFSGSNQQGERNQRFADRPQGLGAEFQDQGQQQPGQRFEPTPFQRGPGRSYNRPDMPNDRRAPFQAAGQSRDGPHQRPYDRPDRPSDRRPPFQGGQSQYNANQGPRRQPPGPMGRQVPSQYQGDPEDSEDVAGGSPRRSRGLGSSRRRSHPGSSLLEQPNFPSRMRGPGSKSHGPAATSQAGFDDGEADAQQDGELDIIPASMLERQEQNVRGVPASWRETIQDQEDKDDLEEARLISQFNRSRMSGDITFEHDQAKDNIQALQMNLDPKLDFGWGTPRMSEVEPLNGHQMLQEAKEHLVHMLDIENEEQWQALTEGIAESFDAQMPALSSMKPKAQEAMLERYVEQAVPKDHPLLPVISQSLTVLQNNPSWGFYQKCQYMQRLIKDVL